MHKGVHLQKLTTTLFSFCLLSLLSCKRPPGEGVSSELAEARKDLISGVEYTLQLSVPGNKEMAIKGMENIAFILKTKSDVILDFREDADFVTSVTISGKKAAYSFEKGHIILPARYMKKGRNECHIEFRAGEGSLNRKDDFLYTLFVPDRASTAFPCFDQPDIKAVMKLSLDIPSDWKAVANGAASSTAVNGQLKTYVFKASSPISTYLMAFAAGRFDTISSSSNGRRITMYHRETDTAKVKRNISAIFESHFRSLDWLENYTGIPYPFEKLDIVMIPDFQYSGMEHPGAIFYRDAPHFLGENPSINQLLSRSTLTAHEVSHQWFGDLVTMKWFNDVWMKEVFAGFMADKIVKPLYPGVNHELSFLLSHYPKAYSVDRTEGANPVRQELGNLMLAGTLYGDIIYNKAPVMMMQLELIMGEEAFRKGIRDYLSRFSMGNAGWEDLIGILDPLTSTDLAKWSNAWVNLPGMPDILSDMRLSNNNTIEAYSLTQLKGGNPEAAMTMKFAVSAGNGKSTDIEIGNNPVTAAGIISGQFPGWILPNTDGNGYGRFFPDSVSLKNLLSSPGEPADDLARASWLVMLHELFLSGRVAAQQYFDYLIKAASLENEAQTRLYILGNAETLWWRFMNDSLRKENASSWENCLEQLINSGKLKPEEKKPLFMTLARTALTDESLKIVYNAWKGSAVPAGIKLDEPDMMTLALEMAVRGRSNADSILDAQEKLVINPDRLAKFRFVRRAADSDPLVRDAFMNGLADKANRRPEPWVTEALACFNHPLRAEWSVKYLRQSLDLLPEIQRTGDIFFPKSWLDAVLRGYNTEAAYSIVEKWLDDNPDVSENLRNKVRQSADILKRASSFSKN